ncbi:MAG: adenosylcobinamide-GDP ribazoletransferase [Clostridia bacterium]|nr:adenosylcobinamide-GDP ribazoletransferase [Clostridia bacterium]
MEKVKKLVTAFFMAWGNFLKIPCPVKRWDVKLNKWMLGFLPSVGLVIGVILALAVFVLHWVPSVPLKALILFMIPMLCAGFIHLDGFMDVNDAILSRRDLEERQRILKDSSIGAFAVITTVILMIAYFASLEALLQFEDALPLGPFLVIPVVSRAMSGLDVLTKKKIDVSQYARTKAPTRLEIIVVFVQLVVYLILGIVLSQSLWWIVIAVAIVEEVSVFLFGTYARKSLGGMNGDIAGYEIVTSEVMGLLAFVICMIIGA